jgi:copper transport protein
MGWRRRWLLVGSLVLGAILGWAAPAGAHASVISSYPATGGHLPHAPATVSVVFDQPVKPDAGGLVLLDSNGTRIDVGVTSHPSPDTLRVGLPPALADGAYVANYTVTSVDGHVVSGGIVFLIGHATPGQIGELARRSSSQAGVIDKGGQFLIYVGVLVAAGLAFFLAFILADGPERSRLGRWCMAAAVLGVGGMVITAGAQVQLTGGGWVALAHWGQVRQVLGGKFGAQCAVQIVGLALCLWSTRRANSGPAQFAAFYGLLLSASAFVLFGHAISSPERWLSIPADAVHVVFAAMWIGGLIGLVVVLRTRTRDARLAGELALAPDVHQDEGSVGDRFAPRSFGSHSGTATAVLERSVGPRRPGGGGNDPSGAGPSILWSTAEVVGRFSTMAGVSVAGLLVAGLLLAIAEVGSVTNLVDTAYGQILLAKIALVGLLLFMAGYNRFLLLPVLMKQSGRTGFARLGAGWRRLLATVRVEAVGVLAVLAVTAVLANSTPSNGAALRARPIPFAQTRSFEGGRISLRITPNQALVNNFVVQFTGPGGAPADSAESVSVYLTLPAQNVGPIEADMQRVGTGRFVLTDTPDPPIIGSWQVTLQIQVSAFDERDVGFVDAVR